MWTWNAFNCMPVKFCFSTDDDMAGIAQKTQSRISNRESRRRVIGRLRARKNSHFHYDWISSVERRKNDENENEHRKSIIHVVVVISIFLVMWINLHFNIISYHYRISCVISIEHRTFTWTTRNVLNAELNAPVILPNMEAIKFLAFQVNHRHSPSWRCINGTLLLLWWCEFIFHEKKSEWTNELNEWEKCEAIDGLHSIVQRNAKMRKCARSIFLLIDF